MQASELAADLNGRSILGVKFSVTLFTPDGGNFRGQYCQGVKIAISNREALRPMRVGLEIADALHRLYPKNFELEKIVLLLGSKSTVERLALGDSPEAVIRDWTPDLDKFRAVREKYLLYDRSGA